MKYQKGRAEIHCKVVLFLCTAVSAILFASVIWSPSQVALADPVSPAPGYFVALDGDDGNSGTVDKPFRTIQKCATTAVAGATCSIRAGTYRERVTPNSGITITAYPNEIVTIDGADPVTGWEHYRGHIYRAKVKLDSGGANQIFVGDEMMTEARWPNGDDLFHPVWAKAQVRTVAPFLVDANLPAIDWTGAVVHFWSGTDPWAPQTGIVTNSEQGRVTYKLDGASKSPYIEPTTGGYYYLSGALGALDTKREWYYDDTNATLYFWAPGNADPNTLDVQAKRRQIGLELSGRSGITIEGIYLFAATIKTDDSSSGNVFNGIHAKFVSHYTRLFDKPDHPTSYWYDHLEDSGVIIKGNHNILENSTISYSAGNGVIISGKFNTINNNLISHVDYMAGYTSGITLEGQQETVSHNTIYASGRFGIYVAQSWNAANKRHDVPDDDVIEYNNISEVMMFSRDGGAIYISEPPAVSGSSIHHNWLHDIQALYPGPASDYPLSGVYLDEGAGGWDIFQNVFWNDQFYSIDLHGNSEGVANADNNIVRNNSILDASPLSRIKALALGACVGTVIHDNLTLSPVENAKSVCSAVNNGASVTGADEMLPDVHVGCSFPGCQSDGPPKTANGQVAASIAIEPQSLSVASGTQAKFSVVGAGSLPLTYQWFRDGKPIDSATADTYSIPNATHADDGTEFSVMIANSAGSRRSSGAKLTVE